MIRQSMGVHYLLVSEIVFYFRALLVSPDQESNSKLKRLVTLCKLPNNYDLFICERLISCTASNINYYPHNDGSQL